MATQPASNDDETHEKLYSGGMLFYPMGPSKGARTLGLEIRQQLLDGKRVLWLFSGGSNIPITAKIMHELPVHLTNQLTIMPIDERYGPVGHKDSNVQQLFDSGFNPHRSNFFAPLDNSSLEATVKHYTEALQDALATCDIVIAQLGMGPDGNIAGILPHSAGLTAKELVVAYQGSQYMHVTLTLQAIRLVNQVHLFAYGRAKRAALDRLCDGDYPIADQPAQILRELKEVYVYNDQLEERNA